jgi:hypothetical protein
MKWTKSTKCSNGACVEVVLPWRKSSYSSDTANCVEVALVAPVLVRDSKDPDSPVLSFVPEQWQAFVDGLRS